jgi:hypothetical protein
VLKSSGVLFANADAATKQLAPFEPLIEARAAALQNEVSAAYKLAAATWKAPAIEPPLTDLEKEAARLVIERIPPPAGEGGPGGPGGGFGGGFGGPQNPAVAAAVQKIPQHMRSELTPLLSRGLTALEIRDFLTGEFEPVALEYVVAYLRAAEKAGTVKITERAPTPAKGAKPIRK